MPGWLKSGVGSDERLQSVDCEYQTCRTSNAVLHSMPIQRIVSCGPARMSIGRRQFGEEGGSSVVGGGDAEDDRRLFELGKRLVKTVWTK